MQICTVRLRAISAAQVAALSKILIHPTPSPAVTGSSFPILPVAAAAGGGALLVLLILVVVLRRRTRRRPPSETSSHKTTGSKASKGSGARTTIAFENPMYETGDDEDAIRLHKNESEGLYDAPAFTEAIRRENPLFGSQENLAEAAEFDQVIEALKGEYDQPAAGFALQHDDDDEPEHMANNDELYLDTDGYLDVDAEHPDYLVAGADSDAPAAATAQAPRRRISAQWPPPSLEQEVVQVPKLRNKAAPRVSKTVQMLYEPDKVKPMDEEENIEAASELDTSREDVVTASELEEAFRSAEAPDEAGNDGLAEQSADPALHVYENMFPESRQDDYAAPLAVLREAAEAAEGSQDYAAPLAVLRDATEASDKPHEYEEPMSGSYHPAEPVGKPREYTEPLAVPRDAEPSLEALDAVHDDDIGGFDYEDMYGADDDGDFPEEQYGGEPTPFRRRDDAQ